ncbi:MAG: hypothetical protein ACI4O3_02260 [Oscillospiraceae bacterium]
MNGFNPLQDLPMGFGMALAQNVRAMEVFSSLSPDEQRRVVDGTHAIQSKQEMAAYVENLTQNHGMF